MKQFYKMIAGISAVTMLLCTACAENPDSAIIRHKDLEKVIDAASRNDESKVDVVQLQDSERYTADFENESLRVKVHADAAVDIPQTERLSLLRVAQRRFTQDDCDRVRSVLMGDAPLSDWTQIIQVQPRARFEESLQISREELAEAQTAEEREQAQERIDRLQAQYEAAPLTIDYAAYPSDGQLVRNADRMKKGSDDSFWDSYCRDMPDGDTLWAVSQDAKQMMHVQNSDNYSNVIWYSAAPVGFLPVGSYQIELQPLDAEQVSEADFDTIPGETANLSEDDAKAQAEAVLQQLGIQDFVCGESGKCTAQEYLNVLNSTNGAEEQHAYARTYWVLRYYRTVGGAMIEQASGTKHTEGAESDDYNAKMWPAEVIEFRINDSGIARFQWNAPLEITETVVDNAQMKPFSEIAAVFEEMIPVTAAVEEMDTQISIDRVTLSYSRLSEKDDFSHGLIVPIWAFRGSRKVTAEEFQDEHLSYTGVQLSLNAIDGSVINSELGY